MKSETFKEGDLDKWMDEVRAQAPLPGGKGVISVIHPPLDIETKFGKRKVCQVIINGKDGNTINTRLFLPEQFPVLSPKCNLSKILNYYKCDSFKDLIGKEVEVVEVGDMMWNIKFE